MAASDQGPFTLVPLGLNSYTDPAVNTPANVKVQLQNNSNMALSVQIGGANFLIAPFTASTIPTNTSPTMTVLAGAQTAPTGTLTLAWLQPSDEAPMPDGPIVGTSTVSSNMKLVGYGSAPPGYTFIQVPIDSSNRSIWIAFDLGFTLGSVQASGLDSAYSYGVYKVSSYSATGYSFFRVPLIGGLETVPNGVGSLVQLTIINSGSSSFNYFYGLDNQITDVAVTNLATDTAGHLIPIVPTSSSNFVSVATTGTQLLAAPSGGAWYLFGVDFVNDIASANLMSIYDSVPETLAAAVMTNNGTTSINLNGFRTTRAISANATSAGASAVLRYAAGP